MLPLVRRALKVLTDREVTPQLGLLKSTLLQLDSTFSERTYGAGSFRDFAQKLAAAGHVVLREAGRNVLVELSDTVPVGSGVLDQVQAAGRPSPREAQPSAEPHVRPLCRPTARAGPRTASARFRRLFQTRAAPAALADVHPSVEAVSSRRRRAFDERKYGFETLGDLDARVSARRAAAHRARSSGRDADLPRDADAAAGDAAPMLGRRRGTGQHRQAMPSRSESFDRGWAPPAETSRRAGGRRGRRPAGARSAAGLDAEEAPAPPEKPSRRRPRAAKRRPLASRAERRRASDAQTRSAASSAARCPTKPRKTAAKPRSTRSRARTDASHE